MSETVLDGVVARLRQALEYNANAFVRPVALLWPDATAQWQPVVKRLADRLPVITLGTYDPGRQQGPAYWVRCVVARTIEVGLPEGPAVVYLPGVARGDLQAVETCSPELAPIAELQYRSHEFTRPKSRREWSIRAFLTDSERGLGLTITPDSETANALAVALDQLLDERIEHLTGQVIDADFLNELVNPDPISILLGWLDNPSGYRDRLSETQWTAFVQQCISDLGFHPEREGPITAARKLGERVRGWSQVWKRFAEIPGRYPGIVEPLRQAKPMELPFEESDAWPQDNEAAEEQLRSRLLDFRALTAHGARKEIIRLDAQHAWRRGTVWAELGLAPLAFAVEHLARLADQTAVGFEANDLKSLVANYARLGWQADDAALRALAAAPGRPERAAVSTALMTMYRPWLDFAATKFQATIGSLAKADAYQPGPRASSTPGTITVFVDGLRLDIAHRILNRLASESITVELATSLAALPTVTETAKPSLVPVADVVLAAGPGLQPVNAVTGAKASIHVLRSLMQEAGVQVLGSAHVGDPSGLAWTEVGELDHRGHDVGIRLVDYLDEDVDRIVGRILELLDAGWARVEILTDHGWILMPDALDKVELPPSTTEVKKGRCARLKVNIQPSDCVPIWLRCSGSLLKILDSGGYRRA